MYIHTNINFQECNDHLSLDNESEMIMIDDRRMHVSHNIVCTLRSRTMCLHSIHLEWSTIIV